MIVSQRPIGMSRGTALVKAALIAGLAVGMSAPALADSIDGDWCSDTGRRVAIEGSRITSPKGIVVQGEYAKYSVRFVMPGAEPDAGSNVTMVFRRGQGVEVAIAAGTPRLWRKCQPGIS